ncbi:MAG: FkbM family methyltransferase [Actinobacteria bacterium]|nr:FkbM family methyltransferase [Actinomycetota bacterium]
MTQSSRPTKRRFVVATNWSRPTIVLAAATLVAPIADDGLLVITTPSTPSNNDEKKVDALRRGIPGGDRLNVSLESFRQVLSQPHDGFVVPQGDIDALLMQLAEISRLVQSADERPRNSGVPERLEKALHGYADIGAEADALTTAMAFHASRPPYQGTYIGGGRLLVRTSFSGSLVCPSHDLARTPRLLLQGEVDEERSAYLRSKVLPGQRVLQIGAGFGEETVLVAQLVGPTGRVVALEASPSDLQFLRENLILNRADKTVELVEAQLDDHRGPTPFDEPPGWYGPALGNPWHGSRQHPTTLMAAAEHTEVPTTDLAPLMESADPFELAMLCQPHRLGLALTRLRPLLDADRISRLLCSVAPLARPDDWTRAAGEFTRLVEAGWTLAAIGEEGQALPAPLEVLLHHEGHLNVVLTTPTRR